MGVCVCSLPILTDAFCCGSAAARFGTFCNYSLNQLSCPIKWIYVWILFINLCVWWRGCFALVDACLCVCVCLPCKLRCASRVLTEVNVFEQQKGKQLKDQMTAAFGSSFKIPTTQSLKKINKSKSSGSGDNRINKAPGSNVYRTLFRGLINGRESKATGRNRQ